MRRNQSLPSNKQRQTLASRPSSGARFDQQSCLINTMRRNQSLPSNKQRQTLASRPSSGARVLRLLGYPYVLSKQYLSTPGAPHAWPSVLGALDWLREEVSETAAALDPLSLFKIDDEQDREEEPAAKVMHEFGLHAYHANLRGEGVTQQDYEELRRKCYRILFGESADQVKEQDVLVQQLDAELASYNAMECEIANLKQQSDELASKATERSRSATNLQSQVESAEAECERLRTSKRELMESKTSVERQLANVQHRIKTQEDAGIGQLSQEFFMLTERLKERQTAKAELQKEIEQKELAYSRREGLIAPALDEYNRLTGILPMPEYEEIAKHCNLQIRTYRAGFDVAIELPVVLRDVTECLGHINSAIAATNQSLTDSRKQIEDAHADMENLHLPQLRDQQSELRQKLQDIQQRLAEDDAENEKVEEEFEAERQTLCAHLCEIRQRTTQSQDHVNELQTAYDDQMQEVADRMELVANVSHQVDMYLPSLRSYVDYRDSCRELHNTRMDAYRHRMEGIADRIAKKVEDALADDIV